MTDDNPWKFQPDYTWLTDWEGSGWYPESGTTVARRNVSQRTYTSIDLTKFGVCRGKFGEYAVMIHNNRKELREYLGRAVTGRASDYLTIESKQFNYNKTIHVGTLVDRYKDAVHLLGLDSVTEPDGNELIVINYTHDDDYDRRGCVCLNSKLLRKCMRLNLKEYVPPRKKKGAR